MNTINVGGFNFIGNNYKIQNHESMQRIKDIHPEIDIKTDSLDISQEGLKAFREKVQSLPGYFDWNEELKIREIESKVQLDPVYNHRAAMDETISAELERIKSEKMSYTLDDLMSIRMEAFSKQYFATAKAWENDERDIYNSGIIDADGKITFRKIEIDEDFSNLDKAFRQKEESLGMLATVQEQNWKIRHQFGHEPALGVKLPEDYDKKLVDIMERAKDEVVNSYQEGKYDTADKMASDAERLSMKYLREDSEFYNAMTVLFSKLKPMIK